MLYLHKALFISAEQRNGRITEWRKMTPNPKRQNCGTVEGLKIPQNPIRRND